MKPPRAWQRMLSGRRLDILQPSPVDIEIEDIARGLAFVARWNGQTVGEHPYSVAEHSLLVESIFGRLSPEDLPRWRLAALLHDAAEYVIGDMISPVKGAIGPEFPELEDGLMRAVNARCGLPFPLPPKIARAIKKADRASAWLEATQIAGFGVKESSQLFGRPPPAAIDGVVLRPRPPEQVRTEFEARASALIQEMDARART